MIDQTASFLLELVRPLKIQTISILWLEVEGMSGNFVIGAGHSPLISILKPKSFILYQNVNNEQVKIDVFSGGIVTIKEDGNVVLIMDN